MPLHVFRCASCGKATEELFFASEEIPDKYPCEGCGVPASRERVHRFRHVGPIFSDMERYERALLSRAQREDGARFRGPADVAAAEAAHGMQRVDTDSPAYRAYLDDARDEVATIDRVRREDGVQGAIDWVDRQEVCEEVGWDDSTYSKWRADTDAVDHAIESGAIAVPDAGSPGG